MTGRASLRAALPSKRTLHWFGDKSRDELLLEIDRIITTDKPALAALYERLDGYERALRKIAHAELQDHSAASYQHAFTRLRGEARHVLIDSQREVEHA